EMPSNLGLAVSFLCNIGMILLLDWDRAAQFAQSNSALILALLLVSGFGCGMSYRTITKYQAQSDALFGRDKYAYLCSCLGAISGLILGAVLLDYSGSLAVRVVLSILSALTVVLSIALLEDLDSTVATEREYTDNLESYTGAIVAVIPVGAACCFLWVYISHYFYLLGYSASARAFCMAAPIIAFCFGNRLRLKSQEMRRAALLISAILAALSFLPTAIKSSPAMALLSGALVCLSVIFAASAIYSIMRKEEIYKFTMTLQPIAIVGIAVMTFLSGVQMQLWMYIVGAILLLFGVLFMLTDFPKRIGCDDTRLAVVDGDDTPAIAQTKLPALMWAKGGKKEDGASEKPEKKAKEKPEKKKRGKPVKEKKSRVEDVLAAAAVANEVSSEPAEEVTTPPEEPAETAAEVADASAFADSLDSAPADAISDAPQESESAFSDAAEDTAEGITENIA
ncbi:MAG: hypothetical protein IJC18_00135, partial [Clostridia bacterium]|nr:hypothetical protein [Clostridia bacterium]